MRWRPALEPEARLGPREVRPHSRGDRPSCSYARPPARIPDGRDGARLPGASALAGRAGLEAGGKEGGPLDHEEARPAFRVPRPASCVLRPASRVRRPASCVLRPASCVPRPAPCVLRPASSALRPASRVRRSASCVLRPASCVLRPASCVLRPASCVLRPASRALRSVSAFSVLGGVQAERRHCGTS